MARKKPKTLRAIEGNAGTRIKLADALTQLSKNLYSETALEVLRELHGAGYLSGNTRTRGQKKLGWEFFRRKLTLAANTPPGKVTSVLERVIASKAAEYGAKGDAVSEKFCRLLLRDASTSQRGALQAAGIPTKTLKNAWSVPINRTLRVSQGAAEAAANAVTANAAMVRRMNGRELERLKKAVLETLENGGTTYDLRETIWQLQESGKRYAVLAARDQTSSLTQAVVSANAEALGCRRAIWVHVPGEYTSRDTHEEMDGKRFNLDEGMFDPDPKVQRMIKPGELPNCRCTFRPLLPAEISTPKSTPHPTAGRG